MEIYEVIVCKFCGREKGDFVEKLEVEDYTQHICVFNHDTRIAKDLESEEEFYVLKKDGYGRILNCESDKIDLNTKLGVAILPFVNMDELSLKRQIKIYRNYRKVLKEKTKQDKQKSIKR